MKIIGRLDLVVELEGPSSGIYHVQFKTLYGNASIGSYLKDVAVSMHERGYAWLGRQQNPPLPIKGTYLVVFQKQVTGPVNKKTGVREVEKDWSPFTFERVSITKTAREQFVKDCLAMDGMIEECLHNEYFPHYTKNCVQFNKPCIAYDWCRSGMFFPDEWEERPIDYADEAEAENISRLLTFQTCPRLYEILYIDNLRKKSDEKRAADFGTAIHKAMEVWYGPKGGKKFKDGSWKPAFNDGAALTAFEHAIPSDHDENCKETETTGYGKLMLERYFERYKDQHSKLFKKILGAELVLEGEMRDE